MYYNKIVYFLWFLSCPIFSVPWYFFADNEEVEEFCQKNSSKNISELSNGLYTSARQAYSLRRSLFKDTEKIGEVHRATASYVAFLIKASDLGHKKAKMDLSQILANGKYGVDQNYEVANRLLSETFNPYIEKKPWYTLCGPMDELKPFLAITDPKEKLQALFDHAESLLSLIISKKRLDKQDEFVAALIKASDLGSARAKGWLAQILHEGSYGILRDNEKANNLESEVVILELEGFERDLVNKSLIQEFHYNPVTKTLDFYHAHGHEYYYGSRAEKFYKIFSYLEKKKLAEKMLAFLSDMETVD